MYYVKAIDDKDRERNVWANEYRVNRNGGYLVITATQPAVEYSFRLHDPSTTDKPCDAATTATWRCVFIMTEQGHTIERYGGDAETPPPSLAENVKQREVEWLEQLRTILIEHGISTHSRTALGLARECVIQLVEMQARLRGAQNKVAELTAKTEALESFLASEGYELRTAHDARAKKSYINNPRTAVVKHTNPFYGRTQFEKHCYPDQT